MNTNKPITNQSLAFKTITNPYIVGNAIKSTQMFFGRENDFNNIKNEIINDGHKVILLIGGRRSGKSSILFQILNGRLSQAGEAVLCDFQQLVPRITQDEYFPREMGKVILGNPKFKHFEANFLQDDNSSWTVRLEQLVQSCIKLIAPRKLIILCDEFESIEKLFNNNYLSDKALLWVQEIRELPVQFVMTSSREFENKNIREVFSHITQMYPIHELSQKDALALIQKPIGNYLSYKDKVLEIIYRLSGGQPFYTQYICQNIVNHVNVELKRNYVVANDLDAVIDFIVRNPTGQIQETWNSLANPNYAPKYGRETLAALANTISDSNKSVSVKEILKTVKKKRFKVEKQAMYQTLSWFIKNDRLLERDSESYRFRMDLIRHWIAYEYQNGENVLPMVGGSILPPVRTPADSSENCIEKYKESCQVLKDQYPNGVPKDELKTLRDTYVSDRLTESQAKEIEKILKIKIKINSKFIVAVGITIVLGVASWFLFEKPPEIDKIKPTGEVLGIKPSYTQGDKVDYSIKASDNEALSSITFIVENSPSSVKITKTWKDSSKKLETQQLSFATTGWQNQSYNYLLTVVDKHGNQFKTKGTFLVVKTEISKFQFIINASKKKKLFLVKSSGENEFVLKNYIDDYQLYPSISMNNNLLVFQKGVKRDAKICIVDLKTRTITNDCKHPGKMPYISPNGKKIVYIPNYDDKSLEIMNLNDFNTKNIPLPDDIVAIKKPVFLNDSKNIVFLVKTENSNHQDVMLYQPDSSQFDTLYGGKQTKYLSADMNSDSVLFTLNGDNGSKIFVMSDIVENRSVVEIQCKYKVKYPVFSKDGKRIYFISGSSVKYITASDKNCQAIDYNFGKLDLKITNLIQLQYKR